MIGPDVPDSDMLNLPWRFRADIPPAGDPALDSILESSTQPKDAADPLWPVAEVLAALRSAPDGGELAGFDRALTAFRIEGVAPDVSARPQRRRPAMLRRMLRARFAAAVAVAVAAISAVSYAGVLPASLQLVAHETIGAPAAKTSGHPHPAPHAAQPAGLAGRGPAGSAAYGLCTAYQHALTHGNATQRSVAFRKLAAAAGGSGKVAAYCAQVPHPGSMPSGRASGHTGDSDQTPPGRAVGHTPHAPHTPPGKAVGHSHAKQSEVSGGNLQAIP